MHQIIHINEMGEGLATFNGVPTCTGTGGGPASISKTIPACGKTYS